MAQHDSDDPCGNPAAELVEVFDAVRERPDRAWYRLQKRMERRAASRQPPPRSDGFQRGDVTEPPPVLDVQVDRPEDRERVRGTLVRRCGTHPVWDIGSPEPVPPGSGGTETGNTAGAPTEPAPGHYGRGRDTARPLRSGWLRRWGRPRTERREPPASAAPASAAPATPPETPKATTEELYDLLEELVESGSTPPEPPNRKFGRKPPPPPRFSHLRSLLWLYRINYATVEGETGGREDSATGGDATSGDGPEGQAETDRAPEPRGGTASGDGPEGQAETGKGAKTRDGATSGGDPEQWQESRTHTEVVRQLRKVRLEHARKRLDRATSDWKKAQREGAADRTAQAARARRRAARVVLWRRLVDRASPLLDALAWLGTRAKFDRLDDLVFTPVGYGSSVLTSVPIGFVAFAATTIDNAVVLAGAVVLVLGFLGMFLCVHRPWQPYAWLNKHRYMDWTPRKDGNSARDHRSRGTHVLSRLSTERENEGRIRRGITPPGLHRLAVNAFLDDLHRAYGVSGRRFPWPRRGRKYRPVLMFEAESVNRVAAYAVRLIEDERLRRAYPDPLVLVQVRGAHTPTVVEDVPDAARHPLLPEASGHESEVPSLRHWSRARQAAGALGTTRLLQHTVGPLPERDGEGYGVSTRVLTVPALTGLWGAGAVAVLAIGFVGLPPLAQQHECIDKGLFVPRGITTVGERGERACVGLTYGGFVFDDRLEEVSKRIEKQNKAVDDSGDPYVTIAYLAELDTPGRDTYNSAGVQGEMVGLAMSQAERNASADNNNTRLRFKILIGNAGRNWQHAPAVADEIVKRAEQESLGMDRPIAAVGFGQSVAPNSEAIQRISKARIPLLGTTATYDDVAASGPGQPRSPYFFPTAPANSRIAAQAANWALEGASEVKNGQQITLDPARSAAVIANAQVGQDGAALEQYGPDLAVRFMEAFEEGEGRPWSPAEGKQVQGDQGGGLFFYDQGTSGELPSIRTQIEEICEEDPPDLLYYAGRSEEFGDFLRMVEGGGTEACRTGEVTVLAADDISKYAADEEEAMAARSGPPVFYTPLVPSAPWEDTAAEEHATTFYVDVEATIGKLYDEEDEDEKLPSIAHAATAYDAMRIIDRSLPSSLVPIPVSEFLATEAAYQKTRDDVYGMINTTSGISGNSGYLGLEGLGEGNWNPHRLVQLVHVGTEIDGQAQHVVESCGMNASDSMIEDTGCVDTGASDRDPEPEEG